MTGKRPVGRPRRTEIAGERTGDLGSTRRAQKIVREAISGKTDEYFTTGRFERDMAQVKPAERLNIMERLLAYTTPKLQATTIDVGSNTIQTIEDRLLQLSADAEERIALAADTAATAAALPAQTANFEEVDELPQPAEESTTNSEE